ncbi:uncharacterized protein LOC143629114 [Bidens hawaiensis]|uniref:uncharacterized protein LOC143629114 n=1 Tax=Bidens hawaiensis TaxID=980011 RepID=UPI00404B8A52
MKEMQVNKSQPFLYNELELLLNRAVPKPTSFVPSLILKSLVEDQFCYAHNVIQASVSRVMNYIEQVFSRLLTDNSKQYAHIHHYLKTLGYFWIKELEKKFKDKLQKLFDLENRSVFTCTFDFDEKVKKVDLKFELDKDDKITKAKLGEEEFNVDHFVRYSREELNKALELKQILLAYWDCIIERCGDYWGMHLLDSLREMASVDAMSGFKAKHMSNGAQDKSELPTSPNFLADETNLNNRVECIKKALGEIMKLQFEFPV